MFPSVPSFESSWIAEEIGESDAEEEEKESLLEERAVIVE